MTTATEAITRVCRTCSGTFGFDDLAKDRSATDGVRSLCKGCESRRVARAARKARLARLAPEVQVVYWEPELPITRVCRECKGSFGYNQLKKRPDRRDGVDHLCLQCAVERERRRSGRLSKAELKAKRARAPREQAPPREQPPPRATDLVAHHHDEPLPALPDPPIPDRSPAEQMRRLLAAARAGGFDFATAWLGARKVVLAEIPDRRERSQWSAVFWQMRQVWQDAYTRTGPRVIVPDLFSLIDETNEYGSPGHYGRAADGRTIALG